MAYKNIRQKEAANGLGTVTPDKAFYFYREIGPHSRHGSGVVYPNRRSFFTVGRNLFLAVTVAKFRVEI